MRSALQTGVLLCCLVSTAALAQYAPAPDRATDVFARIHERWEHSRFWYMRPAVPAPYVEGRQVSLLLYWNQKAAGYCSCDLQECREYLVRPRILFSETDHAELPQPCDPYGALAWYLVDRTRARDQRPVLEVWTYPATPPTAEPHSPPLTGASADELARLGPILARNLSLGDKRVRSVLLQGCKDVTVTTPAGDICPHVGKIDDDLNVEVFSTALPKIQPPRAIREKTVPAAAATLVALLKANRDCGKSELVLPFFDDSDDTVMAISRSANCAESVLIFEQSDDGEWGISRAVESPVAQSFYKEKILGNVMLSAPTSGRSQEKP